MQKAFDGTRVQADTFDKFQGQEKNIIILSTVNDDISKFADNDNRLNVAISRAIDQLILVINDKEGLKGTNIGDLIQYIEYNNFSVVDSTTYSVFDYLYSSYSQRRKAYLSNYKKISQYDSENLMYALIVDVLKEDKFNQLKVSSHVPLRMIIKDMEILSTRESEYVSHFLTHVDFLIFDKIGKSPKLVIEVDGVAFHKEETKQMLRDDLKNKILAKYNLPILRFRTDGSREKEKLIKKLEEII